MAATLPYKIAGHYCPTIHPSCLRIRRPWQTWLCVRRGDEGTFIQGIIPQVSFSVAEMQARGGTRWAVLDILPILGYK